ncbi:MAG: UDP-N-acetylmuramate dehydrogenase [Terriglobia bacterium]
MLHTAVRNDLQGLSFSAGIPGSLGGALATNAGAYGMSVGDIVSEATLFSPKTGLTRARGSDLSFSYRRSGVSDRGVLVEARVELESGDPVRIRGELERFSRKRRNSQPLASHTAGSVFKNPAGGFAGQLIDDAGLKGHAVGHAQVSARHANFIVNRGSCSADDIFQLMKKVQREVSLASGHVLEPEVNLIGEFKGSLLRKPSSEGKVAGA